MQVIAAAFYRFLQNGNTWMGNALAAALGQIFCEKNPLQAQPDTINLVLLRQQQYEIGFIVYFRNS